MNTRSSSNELLSLLARANVSRNDVFRCAAESGDIKTFEILLHNRVDVYEPDNDGKTALMLVAENGHVECLKCLVDANKIENINQRYADERTALMMAAYNGHSECVRCLIDTGLADVYLRDWCGSTVLSIAACSGHVECLKCLVDANKVENINQTINGTNSTALMMAATYGHTQCVRCLTDTGLADVNLCDLESCTAFMLAARNGHVECLKCLVDTNKIENINQCDREKTTALMMAAKNGHTECVRCLIDTGRADVNLCDWESCTALMLAALNGHVECLKCLANENTCINQRDRYQTTALMLAAKNGHSECVRCLTDTGLADVNLCDWESCTAFMLAARNGHVECLRCLVDTNKIENINRCDSDQTTALILAAENGHSDCIRCLIDKGLADVNLCGWNGYSALMLAAKNGHVECLKCLVDTNKIENINQRDEEYERTALMMAAINRHSECVKCLIDTGLAEVNLSDRNAYTAIMLAAGQGNYECVSCMIDSGLVDVNLRDSGGYTALMLAARNGHYKCVKCLTMAEGTAINLIDTHGRSALMLAAGEGHLNCIESLVGRRDIDVNHHDREKMTAFMLATKSGHFKCVRLLLSNEVLELNASNQEGHTAFMLASMEDRISCVELLLGHDKVDVNKRDKEGRTALMLAIQEHRYYCIKCLIVNKNINVEERDNEGNTAFMLAVKLSGTLCLRCFFEISLTEEMDLINKDNHVDRREDRLATVISGPYTDGSVLYFPGITWRRPYIHGRDQEGKSVLKLVIRNGLPRCIVCFLLAGLDVVLSENVPCFHTLLDTNERSAFDKNGQTSLIANLEGKNFYNLEYLLQFERIRFHILVLLLREEFCAKGTISLIFYKKLYSLIRNHRHLDQFMYMMCSDDKIGVCVDYLLSVFVCQIDWSNQSALSLTIPMCLPTRLEILLEHVSDKIILFNHIETYCKEFPSSPSTLVFPTMLELLKCDIFLWNWYPKCNLNELNALTRELVIRGFAPGCFEWQGKQSSSLHFAFMSGDDGLVRYLVANFYLTSRDLEHIQRDTKIHEYLHQRDDLNQLYMELFGTPWRLESHSLLTLSNWLRINRRLKGSEKVFSLLPEMFRSTLPFKSPMRMICERQWKKINLNFLTHRMSTSVSDVNMFQGECCNGGCLKLDTDSDDDISKNYNYNWVSFV